MRHPIAEEATQARKLLRVFAGHFFNQRPLAVNNFVVAERQDKILREGIHEREGNFVVIPLAINRVEAHVVEHVVHPTHVPLVIETHAAHVDGLGDERPRG